MSSRVFPLELLCILGLIVTHEVLRRRALSESALCIVDFLATLGQLVVVAAMLSTAEAKYRPEVSVTPRPGGAKIARSRPNAM